MKTTDAYSSGANTTSSGGLSAPTGSPEPRPRSRASIATILQSPVVAGSIHIGVACTTHGNALIDAAERALRDSGFVAATLWVVPDSAQAVRCYERCRGAYNSERITGFGGREIRSARYERRSPRRRRSARMAGTAQKGTLTGTVASGKRTEALDANPALLLFVVQSGSGR
jgi:hypothetical protein